MSPTPLHTQYVPTKQLILSPDFYLILNQQQTDSLSVIPASGNPSSYDNQEPKNHPWHFPLPCPLVESIPNLHPFSHFSVFQVHPPPCILVVFTLDQVPYLAIVYSCTFYLYAIIQAMSKEIFLKHTPDYVNHSLTLWQLHVAFRIVTRLLQWLQGCQWL